MILEQARAVRKVTPISGEPEFTRSYVRKLYAIASNLEGRADALRRHAHHLRQAADSVQAEVDSARRRMPDRANAHPDRVRAQILQLYATKP